MTERERERERMRNRRSEREQSDIRSGVAQKLKEL